MAIKAPAKATAELFARVRRTSWRLECRRYHRSGRRTSNADAERLFSFLIPKREVPVQLQVGDSVAPVSIPLDGGFREDRSVQRGVMPPRRPSKA